MLCITQNQNNRCWSCFISLEYSWCNNRTHIITRFLLRPLTVRQHHNSVEERNILCFSTSLNDTSQLTISTPWSCKEMWYLKSTIKTMSKLQYYHIFWFTQYKKSINRNINHKNEPISVCNTSFNRKNINYKSLIYIKTTVLINIFILYLKISIKKFSLHKTILQGISKITYFQSRLLGRLPKQLVNLICLKGSRVISTK